MTEAYNPLKHSIVQASFGTWCRYECDSFVEALFMAILEEIKRVHWNVYQHTCGPSWHSVEVEDPEIPGIAFTRYYDGCQCEDEPEHRPECRHAKPNFQFEDAQFRWYKYPGRGMSTNMDWSSDQWRVWFTRCLAAIRTFEGDHLSEKDRKRKERARAALQKKYPQAFEFVTPAAEREYFAAMFGAFEHLDDIQTPCWQCSEDNSFGVRGGGVWEGGPNGAIARTLHEGDDPNAACRNCGHVNTTEQASELEARRRKNSDERKC